MDEKSSESDIEKHACRLERVSCMPIEHVAHLALPWANERRMQRNAMDSSRMVFWKRDDEDLPLMLDKIYMPF